ncbi:MAG: ATP-binding cassette domain-containing protein [Gaiellaceae bacterium]
MIEAVSRRLPLLALAGAILLVPGWPTADRRVPALTAFAVAVGAAFALFVVLARRPPAFALARGRARLLGEKLVLLAAAAAGEEVIWRRLVVGGLASAAGSGPALLVGTIGFAGAHRWRGRRAFVLRCAAGATFGAVYLATGSLLAAVACHATYNALVALAVESRAAGAAGTETAAPEPSDAHAAAHMAAAPRRPEPSVAALDHVTKSYGAKLALNDVSFEVQRGEIVALLGLNGAGKTTAISLLLGLRRPTGGEVRLFGLDPRTAAARARVGATPQETGFPPTLTVAEVLRFVCGHYPEAVAPRRLLEEFGLSSLASRQTGGLSGGQRRRLALAAAFAGSPEAVFLDEPTAGLDVEARRSSWATVRGFRENGGTVFFSTHQLEEVDALASRVVVLSDGAVVADGTSQEIRARTGLTYVRLRARELPRLSAATEVLTDGGIVTLFTRDAGRLLYELVAAGVELADLEVRPTSLEDALVALTRVAP